MTTPSLTNAQMQSILDGRSDAPEVTVTLSERFQFEQIQLLRSVNRKLTFFTVLVVIGLVIAFLQAFGHLLGL